MKGRLSAIVNKGILSLRYSGTVGGTFTRNVTRNRTDNRQGVTVAVTRDVLGSRGRVRRVYQCAGLSRTRMGRLRGRLGSRTIWPCKGEPKGLLFLGGGGVLVIWTSYL